MKTLLKFLVNLELESKYAFEYLYQHNDDTNYHELNKKLISTMTLSEQDILKKYQVPELYKVDPVVIERLSTFDLGNYLIYLIKHSNFRRKGEPRLADQDEDELYIALSQTNPEVLKLLHKLLLLEGVVLLPDFLIETYISEETLYSSLMMLYDVGLIRFLADKHTYVRAHITKKIEVSTTTDPLLKKYYLDKLIQNLPESLTVLLLSFNKYLKLKNSKNKKISRSYLNTIIHFHNQFGEEIMNIRNIEHGWSEFLSRLGDAVLKKFKYAFAMDIYEEWRKFTEQLPTLKYEHISALIQIGFCLFKLGMYYQARETFINASKLEPNKKQTLGINIYLGNLYLYQNRYAEAEEIFQELLTDITLQGKMRGVCLQGLGLANLGQLHLMKSRKLLLQAYKLLKENVKSTTELGDIHRCLDLTQALMDCQLLHYGPYPQKIEKPNYGTYLEDMWMWYLKGGYFLADYWKWKSWLCIIRHDFEEAASLVEAAVDNYKKGNNPYQIEECKNIIAWLENRRGIAIENNSNVFISLQSLPDLSALKNASFLEGNFSDFQHIVSLERVYQQLEYIIFPVVVGLPPEIGRSILSYITDYGFYKSHNFNYFNAKSSSLASISDKNEPLRNKVPSTSGLFKKKQYVQLESKPVERPTMRNQ